MRFLKCFILLVLFSRMISGYIGYWPSWSSLLWAISPSMAMFTFPVQASTKTQYLIINSHKKTIDITKVKTRSYLAENLTVTNLVFTILNFPSASSHYIKARNALEKQFCIKLNNPEWRKFDFIIVTEKNVLINEKFNCS